MSIIRSFPVVSVASLCGALAILPQGVARADDAPPGPPCVKGEPGRGGVVTEHSREPNTVFIIHLTDFDYKVIPGQDIHPPSIPDGHGGTTINPVVVPAMPGLCDAKNDTLKPPQGHGPVGPRSNLSIESYVIDPTTGKYVLHNIWGTIAAQVGEYHTVAIPDLYETDALGNILDNVTLYSLVNLETYIGSAPTFVEGQRFNVVDGLVAGLPGMFFSTTPFTFDPDTGFSDPPYTGMAVAETQHGFTATPEPASWVLMLIGIGSVGAMFRARSGSEIAGRTLF
jgi:hypothetical protein